MSRIRKVDVSDGAQAGIAAALAALQPFAAEPQIEALIGKLNAIANPEDFTAEQVAKAERAKETIHKAELDYLREASPAAAASYERDRRAEGLQP